jgi:Protein of unknown function (DUF2844)
MKTACRVLLVLLLGAVPGWAVLGEYQNSVESDQKVMRGEVQSVTRQGYSLHEIKGADGAVVREYVSPDGVVFGLSWQARTMPNLAQLLGSYFPDFQQASSRRIRHRGPLVVRTDRVVIESGGHMRAFTGRAYVPSLVPKNLSAEVVR